MLLDSLKRRGAGGNAEGIGGGAMLGLGLSKQLGMTGIGGAIFGAGAGLFTGGMLRGGIGGTAESTAGGAIMGLQLGGPIGAAIGAGVGLLGGLARTLFGGQDDQTYTSGLIQKIYGIAIPRTSGVITQIIEMAKSSYGGSISVAVRSSQVRNLIQLYAESTGQKSSLFLQNPMAAHLTDINGQISQSLTYQNGTGYAFGSGVGLPTLGSPSSIIPTMNPYASPGPTSVQLVLNGQSAADALEGRVASVSTPSFVMSRANAGLQQSNGRLDAGAAILDPGRIFA
jgi:hypothetical protein